MRSRPFSLFVCSLLFLYFPSELAFRILYHAHRTTTVEIIVDVVLPLLLLIGLIRVTAAGWYTLVTLVALWGIQDLYQFYSARSTSVAPLLVHLGIYCISLGYFINPRIRHLYFDPKQRWWRVKPRYETHTPLICHHHGQWGYPIMRNISEGGCFIETHHPFEMNSHFQISVPLPVPLGVSVIKAEGEVRWVSNNPLRPGMGVQFLTPSPENRKAIREFVHRAL